MPNKKRLTNSAKDFQKQMETLFNSGHGDWWSCFITVLERYFDLENEEESQKAIRMWYSLRLSFRKKLRKEFSKTRKSCSRWV